MPHSDFVGSIPGVVHVGFGSGAFGLGAKRLSALFIWYVLNDAQAQFAVIVQSIPLCVDTMMLEFLGQSLFDVDERVVVEPVKALGHAE